MPDASTPVLYLKSLKISNFRVFNKDGSTLHFQPTLNVIIGENNSGKSAVIDALRYVFNLGSFQLREDLIKIDDQDINRDGRVLSNEEVIEFEAVFVGRGSDVMSTLRDMYVDEDPNGTYNFHMRHQLTLKKSKSEGRHMYKTSSTYGGEDFTNLVTAEMLDFIRSVYLSPLRDIVSDNRRIGLEVERLVKSQVSDDALKTKQLEELPDEMRKAVLKMIHDITGLDYISYVGQNLLSYSSPYIKGKPEELVTFSPSSINRNLYRSMLPLFTYQEHGLGGLDLEANGLGINNLIYASIVLSRKKNEEHFRFFLIEEPEAHLHPQMLRTFFGKLNRIESHQVFVSSHSSMITAEVDITKITLMKRFDGGVPKVTHLNDVYGKDEMKAHRTYLHKFLDSTRSQLLFARSVIFVEGISEALLISKFAELMGKSLQDAGIEIVILGAKGGFDHFAPLFQDDPEWKCAFITDDDSAPEDIATKERSLPEETITSPRTYAGVGTFEYELLRTADKADKSDVPISKKRVEKLQTAFLNATPKGSKTFFDETNLPLSYKRMKNKAVEGEWGGEGLKSNSYFEKSKSEFAFQLGQLLVTGDEDMIPAYIKEAIDYVTPKDDISDAEHTPETNTLG
jgi:putative ATP-dependent endonuclease of OLD family